MNLYRISVISKTEKNSGNKNINNKLAFTPPKNKTKTEKFNIKR